MKRSIAAILATLAFGVAAAPAVAADLGTPLPVSNSGTYTYGKG